MSEPRQDVARWMYLRLLQELYPEFWRALHTAWKAQDSDELACWIRRYNVVDEWLLSAARDTMAMWSRDKESAAASLQPGAVWFAFDLILIPFEPVLDCRPLYGAEGIHEFAARVRENFNAQLSAWVENRIRDGSRVLESQELKLACAWTVMRWSGFSYGEIASRADMHAYEDPRQAVSRAVRRFASRIGLTLGGYKGSAHAVLPSESKNVA